MATKDLREWAESSTIVASIEQHSTASTCVYSPNFPDPGRTLYVRVHVSRCVPSQEFSLIIFMTVTTVGTYHIVHMNPNMQSVHFLIDNRL